jgi:uncharacterized tellurite resistance protein B-like protein
MATTTRKNKDIAGYLILSILAAVDGEFDAREGKIIVDYIQNSFPIGGNFENALELLSTTPDEDYPLLFQKCAEDFYADSTEKERVNFLDFALKLVKADNNVDADESLMIGKLYQFWDIN